jgi:hypothetical protein
MLPVRLTHNAVVGFNRGLCPANSASGAYHELRKACEVARYIDRPPSWLRRRHANDDGYLLLDDERAVLPIRRGRVVACLVNPESPDTRQQAFSE